MRRLSAFGRTRLFRVEMAENQADSLLSTQTGYLAISYISFFVKYGSRPYIASYINGNQKNAPFRNSQVIHCERYIIKTASDEITMP